MIKSFANAWRVITRHNFILEIVNGYPINFKKTVYQNKVPSEPDLSPREKVAYKNAIRDLLKKGAISECHCTKGQFISKYFLRKKSNGEDRFILNLKKLNEFIDAPHFKIEVIKIALKLITKNCYSAAIDLKDSYVLVAIYDDYKKYLRFIFEDRIYEFNVFPFGLSTAPYVFTKLTKPVVERLRSQGLISVVYIDDILMIGKCWEECNDNVTKTNHLLCSLGFIVNEKKSQPVPSLQCKFLGFVPNSHEYSIYLPTEKRDKILKMVSDLLKESKVVIRYLAKVIGTLISACPGVSYGILFTKRLEQEKFYALQRNNENFDDLMHISESMKEDLRWWKEQIYKAKNPIRDNKYRIEIYTDASLTGWGAVCRGEKAHGWWKNKKGSHKLPRTESEF